MASIAMGRKGTNSYFKIKCWKYRAEHKVDCMDACKKRQASGPHSSTKPPPKHSGTSFSTFEENYIMEGPIHSGICKL